MADQTISASFEELHRARGAFDPQLVDFFEADETLTFEVRLPGVQSSQPPGLLIYISPKPGARMPEAWGDVLDRHNLVWVGAQDSGNEIHVARRVGMALLAPAAVARVAPLNAARTILSGFSGGGRVASMMVPAYSAQFTAALYICGANPMFVASEATLEGLAGMPMVFLTGTGDFNLMDTEMAIATFQQAGVAAAELMIVDGLGHALPDAEDLDRALARLTG